MATKKPTVAAGEVVFSKEQLRKAVRFRDKRDVLEVALSKYPDTAQVSISQIETDINDFLKGKVN